MKVWSWYGPVKAARCCWAAIPKAAQVFKEPLMSQSNIFLNDAARAEVESRIAKAGLRGSSFRVTG